MQLPGGVARQEEDDKDLQRSTVPLFQLQTVPGRRLFDTVTHSVSRFPPERIPSLFSLLVVKCVSLARWMRGDDLSATACAPADDGGGRLRRGVRALGRGRLLCAARPGPLSYTQALLALIFWPACEAPARSKHMCEEGKEEEGGERERAYARECAFSPG